MKKLRVFLVDDHQVVRSGVSFMLMTEDDIEVVGEAADGKSAIPQILALMPDVIVLDLQMSEMSGIDVIEALKAQEPDLNILVLTSFSDDDHVFRAIKAGALGYLLKDSAGTDLIRAIRDVAAGESSLHPKIARQLIQEMRRPTEQPLTEEPLTEREMEVLKLIARGLSNQEIADEMVVTERTIRAYVSVILQKLHLANRTQAALYALKKRIVPLDE